MLLSIVTAVYNRADTVADAVHSLRGQTWTDWEHVVQDGGSTDGTLDILADLTDGRTRLESGRDGDIYDALDAPSPERRAMWWASCIPTTSTPRRRCWKR